jgi:mono/diheme cytochrome c family protein
MSEHLPSQTSTSTNGGKKLFMQNCASCHGIRKELTAPALAGVDSRIPDKQLLFAWIRNNQKVLKSGNPYFNELYKTYNKIPMPAFPQLTDADIQSILDYIGEESKKGPIP